MKKSRGFAPIAIIIAAVAVLVLAGGGYWWWQKYEICLINCHGYPPPEPDQPMIQQQQAADETAEPALNNVEDWKTYRNEEYGFEVKYPENWTFARGNLKIQFPLKEDIRFSKDGEQIVNMLIVEISDADSFCNVYPSDKRCEHLQNGIMIDWMPDRPLAFISRNNTRIGFGLFSLVEEDKSLFKNLLSTFKFTK